MTRTFAHRCAPGLALGMLLTTVGCSKATLPPVRRDADPITRQKTYEQWKLEFNESIWLPKWKRNDGAYILPQLERVAAVYPAADDIMQAGKTRNSVIGLIGGIGSGLVGYTLGHRLGAGPDDQLSKGTQLTLAGVGTGLLVASIVTFFVWDDPLDNFAATYNAALKADLNLPAE